MINILHLIDQYKVGGPGKTIINTAKYIDRSRFRLHIATFRPDGNDTELSREIKRCGINYLSLEDIRGISWKNLWSLLNYINVNNVSIYHSHGYKADIYGILLRLLKNDLIIVTTHHGWITNTFVQNIFVYLALLSSGYYDGVITVSEKLYHSMPRRVKERTRCIVIHNALVSEDYVPKGMREEIRKLYGFEQEDIVIGVVGRLSPEKGHMEMIEAFNYVRQNAGVGKLLFVGDGPMTVPVKQRIKALALEEVVVLAGYKNPIQPFYEAMDVLVCPSYTEGLSNVILEAFAYKLPVIATNVGGNSEIIDNGVNGILVENNALSVLGEPLRTLLLDRQARWQYGERGYETAKTRFDFRDRVTKEESFYERLMNGKDIRD